MPSFFEQVTNGTFVATSIATTLGFTCTALSEGKSTFVMETDPARHANVMGTLHGGVIATLADSAMGFAFASTLAEEESFATLEMKVSFLRPVWQSTLTATALVLHRGRTTGLVECRITDERGRLIAHSTCTCLVLRGSQAAGRGLGESGPG